MADSVIPRKNLFILFRFCISQWFNALVFGSYYHFRADVIQTRWPRFWEWKRDEEVEAHELDACIMWLRKAVSITPKGLWYHRWRPFALAGYLECRFERYQLQDPQNEDIDEAIALTQTVVEQGERMGSHLWNRPRPGQDVNQLRRLFYLRYQCREDVNDLHAAGMYAGRAVDSVPERDTNHPDYLQRLSALLVERAYVLESWQDIEDAVSIIRRAHHLAPGRPGILYNLGEILKSATMWRKGSQSIDEILQVLHEGMSLDNGRWNVVTRSIWLTQLGEAYCLRGATGDLDRAASLLIEAEEIAESTGEGAVRRATMFLKLAEIQARRLGLAEALTLFDRALELLPKDHPLRVRGVTITMVNILESWRDRKDSKLPPLLVSRSIRLLREVAENRLVAPHVRFRAAKCWATFSERAYTDAAEAYSIVLELLQRMTSVGANIDSRLRTLLESQGPNLASDAAAAIMAYTPIRGLEKAVEMLEVGRGVFWTRALQLRQSFDDLAIAMPALAAELAEVSRELEFSSFRTTEGAQAATQHRLYADSLTTDAHNHLLSQRWDQLVKKARQVPGFDHFLRPKHFAELCRAAEGGAVIIVNVSQKYCDALIIRPSAESVEFLPLPIKYKEVAKLAQEWRSVLRSSGRSCRAAGSSSEESPDNDSDVNEENLRAGRPKRKSQENSSRKVLSALWTCIVKPIIKVLEPVPGGPLLRLWWSPTGPLTSLPLHAAGEYGGDNEESLMDVAISSYTPTLSALLMDKPNADETIELLAIGQEHTPNLPPLPNTRQELRNIQELVVAESVTLNSLQGENANVENVSRGIKRCNWLHLACHGLQASSRPLDSAFMLHDGGFQLSSIMQLSSPRARFAFLSACNTAQAGSTAPDEGLHLAGAMLFAGFPSVIATSWSIWDEDGPTIAQYVYEHLLKEGKPDASKAAVALHQAVLKLRARGVSILRWAPFIHLGR